MQKQHETTSKNTGKSNYKNGNGSGTPENFDRVAYIRKLEAQAKEWETELAAWSIKASGQLESEYFGWQKAIKEKMANATKQLDALRSAKNDAWDGMKETADKAWSEVKAAFDIGKNKYH